MKTKLSFTLLLSLVFGLLSSQVPQGFNYQAIARDGSGNILPNTPLQAMMYVQSLSTGGTIFWKELHSSVMTNGFGLFTLVVGTGTRQTESTVATFDLIDWSVTSKYLKTEIYYSDSWKDMGTSQLMSVPYALTSGDLAGTVDKLSVKGTTSGLEEALFEVKNRDGQTVFAVYNEGVRVYVSDGAKAVKGGFAVGGFGTDKTESTKYLFVGKDSVRIYLDTNPLTKGVKSGFAVGGYDLTKGTVQDYLDINTDSIRIYIDTNPLTKKLKGGFAVGGYDMTKGTKIDYLNVAADETGIINPSQNRILWYPLKNAFLTGRILVESKDSVGENSFASGYESKAIGKYSQALGYKTTARGNYSTAIGYECVAHATNATSIGWQNNANGAGSMAIGTWATTYQPYSLAIGMGAIASGMYSTSLGAWASSNNDNSLAIGAFSVASADFAMAIGNSATASGDNSYSFGSNTNSTGLLSTSMGLNTTSQSYASMVVGRYNIISGNLITWVPADPLFVVGNGSSSTSRSNALTILKNGQIGLQTVTAPTYALELPNNATNGIGRARAYAWETYSDIRVKAERKNLSYGIKELLQLLPQEYLHLNSTTGNGGINMEDSGTIQIGLIAQEVYEIIPEVVSKPENDKNDLWSIAYDKLIPVIIKAIQEQQAQIESYKSENNSLKSQLQSLQEKIDKIETLLDKTLNE